MTQRILPKLDIGARPGVRSDIAVGAINRWMPDLQARAGEDEATISVLDVIGEDFWGEGVTAKRIAAALRQIGPRDVTVTINSPGGDVFEGIAIYNLLAEHPAKVTVKVLGLAASAASIIAMAGDQILIGRAAFLMIHNSWVMAAGDRHALRAVSEWLEPFDAAMAGVYSARTGMDDGKIAGLMDDETWLNGQRAVDDGFADGYLDAGEVGVGDGESKASALRAERKFDLVAAKAGMARADARALLAEVKGGKPGAAPTGMSGAAELEAGLEEIRALLKT